MSVDIGNIGTVQQGASSVTSAAVSPSLSGSGFASYAASDTNNILFQSPRLVVDPTAGFITEYLSANGSQIISQSPTAVTVAYLRNGLAADGSPKSTGLPAQHVATTA